MVWRAASAISTRRWLVKKGLPLTKSAPAPACLMLSSAGSKSRSPEIFTTTIRRPSARPASTTSESSGSTPPIRWIDQCPDHGSRRDQIAQQFEPLRTELAAAEKCDASKIALRLIDTPDHARCDRVFAGDKHDRNGLSG